MRRRWVILLLCVLLGAVANVVVAWYVDVRQEWFTRPLEPLAVEHSWPAAVPASWPARPAAWFREHVPGATLTCWADRHMFSTCGVLEWECGWPLRSVRRHAYFSSDKARPIPGATPDAPQRFAYAWTPRLPLWMRESGSTPDSDDGRLAVRPILPGFAANTLLYAAVIWLPLRGVGTLRRWRRSRWGRCPACGYDLAGLAGHPRCPECGWEAGPES